VPINDNYLAVNFSQFNKPKSDYPSRLAEFIARDIPRSVRLLDVGSGRGDLAEALQRRGFDVQIADVNPQASSLAGPKFKFHEIASDGTINVDSDQFDVVLLKSVIEHLHDPYPLLREIRRILKSNGCLIVLTPSWRHNIDVFYDAVGHVQPYTERSLKLTLEIGKFSVQHCKAFRQVPWTWSTLGDVVVRAMSGLFRFIPRRVRRPGLRFLREATLYAVALKL